MSHAQSDADSEGLDCLMERKKVCVGKLGSDDRRNGRYVQPHRNTAATDGLTTVLPGIAEVKVQQGKKTQQNAGTSLHEFLLEFLKRVGVLLCRVAGIHPSVYVSVYPLFFFLFSSLLQIVALEPQLPLCHLCTILEGPL